MKQIKNEKHMAISLPSKRQGIINACKECSGLVCCGIVKEGGIVEPPFLTRYDIKQIEYFSGINKVVFSIKRRNPITLNSFSVMRSNINGGCIFFDKSTLQCKIHLLRPMDCRLFPLDIEMKKGKYYWALYKYEQCHISKTDFKSLLAYRDKALEILGEEVNDYASYPVPGMQKNGYELLMKVYR